MPEFMVSIVRNNGKGGVENDDKECICAKYCIILKNLLYVKRATYLYVKPGIHCHFN